MSREGDLIVFGPLAAVIGDGFEFKCLSHGAFSFNKMVGKDKLCVASEIGDGENLRGRPSCPMSLTSVTYQTAILSAE
jgi:hypothetical protein